MAHADCASRPRLRSLEHFQNTRYTLDDFVVMPNHVHMLVTPLKNHTLVKILHSWKSLTTKQFNHVFHRAGAIWQDESLDHIVRNAATGGPASRLHSQHSRRCPSQTGRVLSGA